MVLNMSFKTISFKNFTFIKLLVFNYLNKKKKSKPLVFCQISITNLENEIFGKTSKLLNPRWWSQY